MHLVLQRPPGISQYDGIISKRSGILPRWLAYQLTSLIRSVKRCFVGQMKKHLEAFLHEEGMPTDFSDGK